MTASCSYHAAYSNNNNNTNNIILEARRFKKYNAEFIIIIVLIIVIWYLHYLVIISIRSASRSGLGSIANVRFVDTMWIMLFSNSKILNNLVYHKHQLQWSYKEYEDKEEENAILVSLWINNRISSFTWDACQHKRINTSSTSLALINSF